jgi:DNA-directed RNA polymerase sigma subunit (sigma70/sigma32)
VIERRPGQVRNERGRLLPEFIPELDSWLSAHEERMVRVLCWRLDGWTLSAIGDALGVSRERVRQIEAEARRRIQHEAQTGP